jgi:hypothetical protein
MCDPSPRGGLDGACPDVPPGCGCAVPNTSRGRGILAVLLARHRALLHPAQDCMKSFAAGGRSPSAATDRHGAAAASATGIGARGSGRARGSRSRRRQGAGPPSGRQSFAGSNVPLVQSSQPSESVSPQRRASSGTSSASARRLRRDPPRRAPCTAPSSRASSRTSRPRQTRCFPRS